MRKCSVCGRVLHCVLALASAAFFIHSASGDESPYATGGEVTILRNGCITSYVHVFTNTDEAAEFASTGLKDLKVRYLVVGAGGSGAVGNNSASSTTYSSGGGGGGGVCETDGVPFGKDANWSVRVGAGAKKVVSKDDTGTVAGASSISNGTEEVALVPGGGNGARGSTAASSVVPATAGAAGGGASGPTHTTPGSGTYPSSLSGWVPAGAPFDGGAFGSSSYLGTGGGGAGEKGGASVAKDYGGNGGEGLISDITGERLVYGSGGGGGAHFYSSRRAFGGKGGTRAGDGATFEISDGGATTNFIAATVPAANSGCGGGGGGTGVTGQDALRTATDGADGIVVIRYDFYDDDCPCEGGDIVTKKVEGQVTTWVHQFTRLRRGSQVAEFVNKAGRDLSVRYLVVGAGGSGGNRYSASYYGGGGGGGGGVCEKSAVRFGRDATWQITVGAGAPKWAVAAGASSISNGIFDVETVIGGGNGADGGTSNHLATVGASGAGSTTRQGASSSGSIGIYTNSLFGVEYGPFNGGNVSSTRGGGGGGGASAKGKNAVNARSESSRPDGGEGLASDITGEWLVYGSGGGGGCGANPGASDGGAFWQGGCGGTRAGNGARYDNYSTVAKDNYTDLVIAATMPEPNSGGGGGGGSGPGAAFYLRDPTPGADGIVVISYKTYYDGACPCEGGDAVTRTLIRGTRYTYRHFFTDVRMANSFVNRTGRKLNLRYLVVGGGGGGGNAYASSNASAHSGGGGGGGGVCETIDVPFGADGEWLVRVGAGGKKVESEDNPGTVAGASSISNGTEEVALVPGGGNGGRGSTKDNTKPFATAGAGGGGVGGPGADAHAVREGTYASSIFGVVPAGAPFSGGGYGTNTDGTGSYLGGGGGGAGAAGGASVYKKNGGNGGDGLVSDITGEELYYGSGGGAGGHFYSSRRGVGGTGGPRAGNGGTFETTEDGNVFHPPTAPAANSGCGGGGGGTGTDDAAAGDYNIATDGADGVVIISYDYDATPPGFLMLFK